MSKFIPNSYQTPNIIVDDLMRYLSGVEFKCYSLVARKTTGWRKECDAISISQFMEFTGAGKTQVIAACQKLVGRGLFIKSSGPRNTNVYSLDFSKIEDIVNDNMSENRTSSESELVQKLNITSSETEQVTSSETEHTKHNIKPTIQNNNYIAQPDEKTSDIDNHFERFWNAGLTKKSKQKAKKSFELAYQRCKSNLSLNDFTNMLITNIQQRLKAREFGFDRLHPTTYLNQTRWEDEIDPIQEVKTSSNQWWQGRSIEIRG